MNPTEVRTLNRQQYLDEVRQQLSALPSDEIDLALKFYEEYFIEADNDEAVIEELGKPYHLAKSILSEQSAFSRSAIYMHHKQQRQAVPQSIFAGVAEREVYPEVKTVPTVSLKKDEPDDPDSRIPHEYISKRAFIISMTAIISFAVMLTVIMVVLGNNGVFNQ
jgi:hypothetical protein